MKKGFLIRSVFLILTALLLTIAPINNVFASDLKFYSSNDILFFDEDYVDASGQSNYCGSMGSGSINDPGGPYITEQLVIALLKYIANKKNVPESDVVTKEHIMALVAFAKAEGGDIDNKGTFNLWNVGGGDGHEDLYESYGDSASGFIKFKSFSAAVEYTGDVMTKGWQSRLGDFLTKKDSTIDDFFMALVNLDVTTSDGSKQENWNGNLDGRTTESKFYFYNVEYNIINGVKNSYKNWASFEIGTPDDENLNGKHYEEKLIFDLDDPLAGSSSAQSATTQSGAQTGILLDPGHGGGNLQEVTDAETGLVSTESTGAPGEVSAMWEEANIVKQKLEAAGYRVDMTKNNENDSASLFDKGRKGNNGGYAMAISLHADPAQDYPDSGKYGVAPQRVGQYREYNGKRTTFQLQDVANTSLEYATAIANQTGSGVAQTAGDFFRDDITSKGDIAIVQLISTIPWVYDEKGGAVNSNIEEHAEQIAKGIINSVPKTGANWSAGSSSGGYCTNQNIVNKALEYAWPTHHPAQYLERMPAYIDSVNRAMAANKYVGGSVGGVPGIDCGGFVTRVMQDSGVDSDYGDGGNTGPQLNHLEEGVKNGKYVLVASRGAPRDTSMLQPGDIFIHNHEDGGHTFIYTGVNSYFIDGDVVASASYSENGNGRAPMAGKEVVTDTKFFVFRYVNGK